uniref:Pectinesterase n=1 Tax=Davidia involucrata TaxID=16924 RepID=A0A5B7BQY1_DAVIN
MVNKVVVSLVSVILVVGVVLGVVAVVHNKGSSASVTSSMKSVTTICAPTDHKEACMNSLSSVAKNESATPKDFIMAAIKATVDEVKKAMDVAGTVKVNNETDPKDHMAVEDCKDLFQFAVDELQASYSMVGDSEMHTIGDRVQELLTWLSAAYAYQSTCLDQVDKPEYRSALQKGMTDATDLTSNVIDIIAKISDVLKGFNINLPTDILNNIPTSRRRLLEVTELGHDGYPTWFPAADRKLLGLHNRGQVRPNAVVAKDGSGRYKTINAALAAYPKNFRGRYIIHVKAGVYDEVVLVSKDHKNVFIYGDGPTRTIVTGRRNVKIAKFSTMNSATFAVQGEGFIARSMKFENVAGPHGEQAVALRIQGDRSVVFDCNIEGYQDSLYYHTNRQFYRNCYISGTVDFIFGKGIALIQNSVIAVRKPLPGQANTITADGREMANMLGGLVLQNCKIIGERALFPVRFQIPTYLGRPWKAKSRTIVMDSEMGDLIRPEGWAIWQGQNYHHTCTYAEYRNRGPGANLSKRVKWKGFHVIRDHREAILYTAANFLHAKGWLKSTGVPFY